MQIEKYLSNYINGELRKPIDGEYLDNLEPATGQVYSYIPASKTADVEQAVKAAEEAFPGWSNAGIKFRSEVMLRIATGIKKYENDTRFLVFRVGFHGRIIIIDRSHIAPCEE